MESGTHIINVVTTTMPEINPTLAFVFLKVALRADSTEFKALHDSGCAATTMSTQAFMKLTDSDKIIVTQQKKNGPILHVSTFNLVPKVASSFLAQDQKFLN
jgi:hypothetical protein